MSVRILAALVGVLIAVGLYAGFTGRDTLSWWSGLAALLLAIVALVVDGTDERPRVRDGFPADRRNR